MLAFSALLQALCIAYVVAMPYVVPLQGTQGGLRTLVLLDDKEKSSTFSLFFADLTARGHTLTFSSADANKFKLKSYGEYNYDNILLFAPTVEKLGSMSFNDITTFSSDGGNVMIAVSRDVSDSVRDLTESFGVAIDKKGSEVIDHFETVASFDTTLQHTHFLARSTLANTPVLGAYATQKQKAPVLFHGVGQTLVDPENILALRVLQGNPSTYSAQPNKGPESAGSDTLLVTGVQGRNNARVVVAGSLDMFTNAYFRADSVGNQLFCRELSKWTFRETGVLRFRDIVHHRTDGVPPDVILHEKERADLPVTMYPDPELTRNSLVYRIKDEIVYSMVVEQFTEGRWAPYAADDMQLEFVMLDPYVRKTLSHNNKGHFSVTFEAPDAYGIFQFRVLYRRLGLTTLYTTKQVSLRPFKHDEYERFIPAAYPYYTSAFSMMAGVFVFSVLFLFYQEKK